MTYASAILAGMDPIVAYRVSYAKSCHACIAIVAQRNSILVAFTRGAYIFTGAFSNLIRLVFIM